MNNNQYALITGASGGIGYHFARVLARNGVNVILVARSEDKLDRIANEIRSEFGVAALVIPKDLSNIRSVQELYARIKQDNIEVEYLINNAGFGEFGFFHETRWPREEAMINLNIMALTHLMKLFGSNMVTRKSGRVVNVASIASFQPGPLLAVYFATKAYVLSISEAVANEWHEHGVTVTALCPGPTESGFQAAAAMENSKLVKGKSMPTSEEVAEYGYKAMMGGKRVAVHGFMNRLNAFMVKFVPRNIATAMVRRIQERSK